MWYQMHLTLLKWLFQDEYQISLFTRKSGLSLEWVRDNKYFTPVAKIDDAFGDRNLCTCLPMEAYGDGETKVKTEVLK